jgi:hypothetical protein
MIRPNELRSIVNETVMEWYEEEYLNPSAPEVIVKKNKLVDKLVDNIQEVWFN